MNDRIHKFSALEIVSVVLCSLCIVVALTCILLCNRSQDLNVEVPVTTTIETTPSTCPTSQETVTIPETTVPTTTYPTEIPEVETTTPTEPETTEPEPTTDCFINLTDEEIWLFTQVVYLESRSSFESQLGIASVIVNRMITQGKTLNQVVYAHNQFDVVSKIGTVTPSDSAVIAVRTVIEHGPQLPYCVTYFRAGYYHDWSNSILPYSNAANTYFSHDIRICGNCLE